ncbi:MAG: TetR/AcrR family transcriptional regulator [Caulobacteraceae bacterium]|nr:TetR/AcrR family transcriptional regulator [Caulobacteraceae bacterium]
MNAEPLRRMGRPDQQASEDLVRRIVETAARLFIEQGYAATSIEQVAAGAGSGKQTIYRRFTSKEGLFTEVINQRGRRLLEIAESARTTHAEPIKALEECCRMLLDFVLQPDMISLHRVLVAEIMRFPSLGEYVLNNCLGPFKNHLNALLEAAVEAGQIHSDDLTLTHDLMTGLITGGPVQQALLGRQLFATPAERETYFNAAWALFLRGAR